ncbi:AbgT family transporter [Paeniglutamicibacter psychrophenolicus]|nr:AbgT family transporter [Paeniglutamicibacter psychrophenolicus]
MLKFMDVVERVGNKLPHPFWLFVGLSVVLVLVSALLSALNVSAVSPATGETIVVRNLLSAEGLDLMMGDLIKNFITFPPLGLILVVMLGVSIADKGGLLTALMRSMLARVPAKMVTFTVALASMFAHIASDAAFIVMIPLGMIAFRSVGRSPVIGAIVAYVAVGGAGSVSPIIEGSDAVYAGLTSAAAHTIDPNYVVSPVSNYFFGVVSSLVLAVSITIVTELVVSKRVEAMNKILPDLVDPTGIPDMKLSAIERKAVRKAGIAAAIFMALLVLAVVPQASPLRGEGGSIVDSPLIDNVAVFLMLFFATVGIAYGKTVGTIKSARDVPDLMGQGVRDLVPVIVLFFAVSQFLGYFKWSNVGQLVAINGANFLGSVDAPVMLIFVGAILLISIMNLLLTSGIAMWSLVGPVLVPMFMLLDIYPETSQALFRIADAPTNSLTPMSPYFVIALEFIRRVRPSAGIGTLMSLVLPLTLVNLAVWIMMFLGWYALGIPLGPGAPVR